MKKLLTLLAVAGLLASVASAQGPGWLRHNVTSGFSRAFGVSAGDFNGDTYMDIVGADHSPERLVWWKSDGEKPPAFVPNTITAGGGGYQQVFAIDLDQDGIMDFLSAEDETDDIIWWKNDGLGNFTPRTIDSDLGGAISVYACDLNDNTSIDILAAGRGEDAPWSTTVVWYENAGAGNWIEHPIHDGPGAARCVFAVDFDGDKHMEVLVADMLNGVIRWWKNDGQESFVEQTSIPNPGSEAIYVADFDSDGDADIAGTSREGGYVAWWENDGNQQFTIHVVATNVDFPASILVADFNGDSYPDIVAATKNAGAILLWENGGSGDFPPENEHTLDADFPNATRLWAEDMNDDGAPDILCAGGNYIAWWENPNVTQDVYVDIKPGSCPNPLNVRALKENVSIQPGDTPAATKMRPDGLKKPKPVLPAAVLGTSDFDVADIEPATVMLEGVPILRWNIEDVSTPVGEEAEECECNTLGPDGYADLTLKFDRSLIVEALGEVYDGDIIPLTVTGALTDGTPFEGTDCVVIRGDSGPVAGAGRSGEPPEVSLLGNFPNPFNPTTEISFSLLTASQVKLDIFNVMGQKVATLVEGQFEAGEHIIQWNGSGMASGVYFYRLQAGEFTETRKMMLLK